MSGISELIEKYGKYIEIPWRDNASSAQRVIYALYSELDELHLRVNIGEFEIATRKANHGWASFDLTDTFPDWLISQRYADSYFRKPELIATALPKYLTYITEKFERFLNGELATAETVVALTGVGSLFGLLKVKEVVDKIAPMVTGRLLVLFPGSCEDNNYRLLDAYDGWDYLGVPITADKEF